MQGKTIKPLALAALLSFIYCVWTVVSAINHLTPQTERVKFTPDISSIELGIDTGALVIDKLQLVSENLNSIIQKQTNVVSIDLLHKSLDSIELLVTQLKLIAGKDGENADICEESFPTDERNRTDGLAGYPMFYTGFKTENCSGVPEFHTLLTLVYNFVHYTTDDLAMVPALINNVNKEYPNVQIIAAVPAPLQIDKTKFNHTTFIRFKASEEETTIWNYLITRVKTKYLYIGRNTVHFTWFERLERLVREINNLNAYAVGSAIRGYKSGQWTNGCEQSTLRNYTLVYRHGYDRSMEECMICQHMHGPFVTKRAIFSKFPLQSGMTSTSGFALWFLSLQRSSKMAAVCPDAMSFVSDSSRQLPDKTSYLGLASHLKVEKVVLSAGTSLKFDCSEANTSCSSTEGVGLARSQCCLGQLLNSTKHVMAVCKEKGLICELAEGTVLGAIKFNSVLPWEADSDLGLAKANFTAFDEIVKPQLIGMGYNVDTSERRFFEVLSPDWFVEVFTVATGSEDLLKQGITPTNIYYHGMYASTPISPGLYARNRYGKEIYKHAQHWSDMGRESGWDFYQAGSFIPCPKPGHHACLDRYIPDGNLQFSEPTA